MSNTRDSVSSAIQTPRVSSKILRCASYFQLSSRCLDIPMKRCLSCLIYYLKDVIRHQGLISDSCSAESFTILDSAATSFQVNIKEALISGGKFQL